MIPVCFTKPEEEVPNIGSRTAAMERKVVEE
jgi:hypothetical protein